jgi:hypothetical protein
MQIYLRNWYDKFLAELSKTKKLKIISPFISEQIIRKIQTHFDFGDFELITRFNLRDFASNISSLDGLKFAVEEGAKVFGIRELHSKVYLFDDRTAIITSANLTNGGMVSNYECGLYTDEKMVINGLQNYFNELKAFAGQPLTISKCEQWQNELAGVRLPNTEIPTLPDYGATKISIDKKRSYYVKFLGADWRRAYLTSKTKDVIEESLCHYAVGFSISKTPRQINDGDIIYMSRMTERPNNYAIFGKAEAIKFVDGRDEATENEKNERRWKRGWSLYLRVKNPVFIKGVLGDCVLLYDLIKALDYEGFNSTSARYRKGERDINPYNSLRQQPYVKLTLKGAEWIETRFNGVLNRLGRVEEKFIKSLPQSEIDINNWTSD